MIPGMVIRWASFLVPIPPGWEACSRPGCLILRKEGEHGGNEAYIAPVCDSTEPLVVKDAVASLMSRRVKQGRPEEGMSEFCGLPAYEAKWCDGVTSIRSRFFVHGGKAFESAAVRPSGGPSGYGDAEKVLDGVRLLSEGAPGC